MSNPEPRELARVLREDAAISESYASLIANGHRKPSARKAVEIWRKTGLKLGPMERLADGDAEVFARAFE